jgi:hypothetical protein
MEQKIDKTPILLSVTALAVSWGFHRALETNYGYLFSDKEVPEMNIPIKKPELEIEEESNCTLM